MLQTEVPKTLLEEWLALWSAHYDRVETLQVALRPRRAGGELLEFAIQEDGEGPVANVIFAPFQDREGRNILSVRDQNTYVEALRKKRLMSLIHLWLIHRYNADSVHYVTPTEDNQYQTAKMQTHGIFASVDTEGGLVIVADVDHDRIRQLLAEDRAALSRLISKAD